MLYAKCRFVMFFIASLITLCNSIAQPTPLWFERVQLQMMVSSSYSINANNPASDSNSYRASDLETNRFLLDMVQISLQQTPSKPKESGFRFDLAMGEVARIYPTGLGSNGDYSINQAYISYIAPLGKGLRADAGLFATHCGYEFMEGVDGWNDHATHSFRYAFAEPTVHSGLRLQYPWSERFTTSLILAQSAFSYRDNNKGASYGLQVTGQLSEACGVILNYFGGPEQDNDTKSMRHFFDMSVNHELTESIALGVNYDYGIERDTTNAKNIFTGAGIYATYKPEKQWSVAFRADVFADRSGIQTGSGLPNFTLQGYTLTPQWELTKNLLIRSDLRVDFANVKVYPTETDLVPTQPTITLNAVYHF